MAGRIRFGTMTGWFAALAKACHQGPGPKIVRLGEGNLQPGSLALEIIERLKQGRVLLSSSVYRCQNYGRFSHRRQDSHFGVVHPSAPLSVSSLPSATIHRALPSGIPSSIACSVKSAKIGLANPSPTSTRSSSSSVPPKRNPASPSVPISSQTTTTPESRSQTRKCVNSTSFPTKCSAVGTIPYAPLRM